MSLIAQHSLKLTNLNNYEAIADFVIKHGEGHYGAMHRQIIIETCRNFDQVGQLFVIKKCGEIVAVTYFDWKDKDEVIIRELVVHKKHRNRRFLKSIILRGWLIYPQAQFIRYGRRKYNNRTSIYHFTQFFKGDL